MTFSTPFLITPIEVALTHRHLSKFFVQFDEIVIVSAILLLKFDGSGIRLG